jgi:hypothetical protein
MIRTDNVNSTATMLVVSGFACYGIKEQTVAICVSEMEHVIQGTCALVERLITDAAQAPVILDEAQDRTLVGY